MRDAFGGIVNLVIIVVFLVIVSGYLAFNVNYTKAFRVKNKIITTLEQYEGNCASGSSCDEKITEYMASIGYSADNFNITGYTCQNGYCIKKYGAPSSGTNVVDNKRVYFKVVTQINLSIPIVSRILPSLFQVSGNTKLIEPTS